MASERGSVAAPAPVLVRGDVGIMEDSDHRQVSNERGCD